MTLANPWAWCTKCSAYVTSMRHRRICKEHKPAPVRVQSRCRVDCSCGWKGPVVPTFGQGQAPWVEHYKEASGAD